MNPPLRAETGSPVEIGRQIVGQRGGRRIAQVRRLLQALQRDHLQIAIGLGVQQPRRHRVLLEHQQQRIDRRGGLKRRPAGEHLVEDRAEAVDVARRADLAPIAADLLGGHVARRADDRAGVRQAGVVGDPLGQAEIGDVRLARRRRSGCSTA